MIASRNESNQNIVVFITSSPNYLAQHHVYVKSSKHTIPNLTHLPHTVEDSLISLHTNNTHKLAKGTQHELPNFGARAFKSMYAGTPSWSWLADNNTCD